MNDAILFAAARRAYERGRVMKGVRRALVMFPVTLLPLQPCMAAGRGGLMFLLAAAVATLVVLFHWRGQDYARGANVGWIAGLSPLLLPWLATWIAPVCSTLICGLLPAASVAGGFTAALCLAGGVFGDRPSIGFWFAAITMTVTLGVAGCLHVGLAGLAGMAIGLAVGSLPVVAAYAIKVR